MNPLTLMPIFAHPDDESFAGTGALVRHAREGVRVVLVMATRGERGKAGNPPICIPEQLPSVREQELREACDLLGVSQLRFLNYRDKELGEADESEAVGRIVAAIREFRPQVLYTFPPDGHSAHPDHLAINRLAGLAFTAAGDPSVYPEAGSAWQPARLFWNLREGAPERTDVEMESEETIAVRVEALKRHRTQHQSIDRFFRHFDPEHLRQWMALDRFHLAMSAVPRPQGMLKELFAGLR